MVKAKNHLPCLLLAAIALAPDSALGAGGAHIVDDSEVETPGDCHLETHATGSSQDGRHLMAGVGCTPETVPMLELGAFVAHAWAPAQDETVVGLAPKVNLRPAETGLGIALAGSLGYGADRSRLEYATLTAALTVPASESLRINANAGWGWTETGPGSELFVGAQAELTVSPEISLMAEAFTRDHGKAGGQAGVRWTTGKGRIDLDLLAGRFLDGATATSLTAGLTVRW